MQQFDVFWKLSENLQGSICDGDHFSKALVLQNGFKYGIVVQNSKFIKDFSNSHSFFLLSGPKYLGTKHSILSYTQISHIVWKIFLTKNPWNLKGFSLRISLLRRHWRRSGVFIVDFEHISHLVLVFLLLTLSR